MRDFSSTTAVNLFLLTVTYSIHISDLLHLTRPKCGEKLCRLRLTLRSTM